MNRKTANQATATRMTGTSVESSWEAETGGAGAVEF
jgi:hypothetical protein